MAQPNVKRSIHEPLNEARNEIRLLKILPPPYLTQDSTIRCRLSTYSLDDRPKYTALSYVWGDSYRTCPIKVNGQEVQVTTNLADALFQLREYEVHTVWVDAVCIDQKDDEEKGHQVQKMKDIYQSADEVVAWLGPEDARSKRGIQVIRELAEIAESLHLRNVFSPKFYDVDEDQYPDMLEGICDPLLHPSSLLTDGDIGVAISLMEREYWTRLWVLQEIGLAKHVTLLCGSDNLSWEDAEKAMAVLRWLRVLSTNSTSGYGAFKIGLHALYEPYMVEGWEPPPAIWLSASAKQGYMFILHLLNLTCNGTKLQCLDPRDRIYALFGFLQESSRSFTAVNYSTSYVDLFTQATLFMLQNFGPDALLYAGLAYRDEQGDKSSLPSWVVDWRCTRHRGEELLDNVNWKEDILPMRLIDGYKIAVDAAPAAEVVEVIPLSGDLRSIVERFDNVQLQHRLGRPEGKGLPVLPLKVMIWRTLLYRRWPDPLTYADVNLLFERCIAFPTKTAIPTPEVGSASRHSHENNTEALHTLNGHVHSFEELLWNRSPRSLFITAEGVIGSGPPCTQAGDMIYAISGFEMPVLLRADKDSKAVRHWNWIGLAYVDDMLSLDEDWKYSLEDFWATDPKTEEVILT